MTEYDVDTIISYDDLRKNKEIMRSQNKVIIKKLKLKRWIKNILWLGLGAFAGIAIYQIITIETIQGNITCRGGLVQICSTK